VQRLHHKEEQQHREQKHACENPKPRHTCEECLFPQGGAIPHPDMLFGQGTRMMR
jgi:hypothetical protein